MSSETIASPVAKSPRRAGRKPKDDGRADELRQVLVKWSYYPENSRPSLRDLAEALNTSHQLLSHFLVGIKEWERNKDLVRCRANAKSKGILLTEKSERELTSKLRQLRRRSALSSVKYGPRLRAMQAQLAPALRAKCGIEFEPPQPMEEWTKPPDGKDIWNLLRSE